MIKALAACGLVLALFVTLVPEVGAQTSCGAWNSKCKSRCKEAGDPDGCPAFCARKMSACKSSGCWAEAAKYGSARHCNLKKS